MNDIKIYLILFLLLTTGVVLHKKNKTEFANSPAVAQAPQTPKVEPAPPAPKVEPKPESPTVINTYDDALKAAKATNKKIFLYFGADWCHYCREMKRTTLADKTVKDTLTGYVVYFADRDKETSLVQKYNVRGIPAYMVIDANEKVIKQTTGMKGKAEFLAWLQ